MTILRGQARRVGGQMLGPVAHEAHEAGGHSQSMMDSSGGLRKRPEGELVSDVVKVKTPEWCRIT